MSRKYLGMALIIALFAVAVTVPAQAQNSPVWYAEYYNNAFLQGTPALTRYEQALNFNWGVGSPGAGVNADNFSARFATDVSFQPGTYRFFAQADDNVKVTFNFNNVVIDTFGTPQIGTTVSGDVTVTQAGVYHIQVDYREVDGNAMLNLSYGNAATNPQPNFGGGTSTTQVNSSPWTAQYYANGGLAGDPVAIVTVNHPSFNYGAGSPLPSVPVDNWSARFTSVQNLAGGNYTLQVRADDGVRVYVNGGLAINQFGGFPGQTFTTNLTLPAGANNFQVEYLEINADAYLDYQLLQQVQNPNPTQPVTGASVTISAYRLNVREQPNATAPVLTRVNRNETYAALGRNAAGTWYQVNVNGTVGWVSASYVSPSNAAGLTVTEGGSTQQPTQPPQTTGITVTASPYTVNIRSGAGTTFARIARLPVGQTAQVIGRDAPNQWWQINYNGISGWVTAQYAELSAGADVNSIPVTN